VDYTCSEQYDKRFVINLLPSQTMIEFLSMWQTNAELFVSTALQL